VVRTRLVRVAPTRAERGHQARHPVTAGLDALPSQGTPQLARAIHAEVVMVDAADVELELGVGQRPRRGRP
jgi:hypothetical protein